MGLAICGLLLIIIPIGWAKYLYNENPRKWYLRLKWGSLVLLIPAGLACYFADLKDQLSERKSDSAFVTICNTVDVKRIKIPNTDSFKILIPLCSSNHLHGLSADIARLKIKDFNFDEGYFSFERIKIKGKSKSFEKIRVDFVKDSILNQLIERRFKSLLNPMPEDYFYQILQSGLTPKQEKDKIQQFSKVINFWLSKVSNDFEFEKKITMTWATHSHATINISSGENAILVSKGMGHKTLKTTLDNYVSYSETEMKEKANRQDKLFNKAS